MRKLVVLLHAWFVAAQHVLPQIQGVIIVAGIIIDQVFIELDVVLLQACDQQSANLIFWLNSVAVVII